MDRDYNVRENVRQILIECRKEKGLTQTQVGEVVGKTKTAVASWEQGLTIPDIETLYRLSKYYGKTINYMYGERESKEG